MSNKWASVLLALCLIYSCKKDLVEPEPQEEITMVKTSQNASLGTILTDQKDNTLYFFSNDLSNSSNCSGGCLDSWSIFYMEDIEVSSSLNASDFGQIDGTAGKQTTYKGWPLYFFKNDTSPGQTNGEGVNGNWWVAKPDYSIMFANGQLKGADGLDYKSDYSQGTGLTRYLVDGLGRTLYAFSKDNFNVNQFTNPDFSNNAVWPIYEASLASVPSSLNKADFGSLTIGGKTQLTYKGWPLYYFGQDNAVRGNNKGISFPAPGIWPILNENTSPAPQSPHLKIANDAVLGKYLTDQDGKALYFFSRDAGVVSNCNGACANTWPVYHIEKLQVASGLSATDFAEITRNDGSKQTTYKGWPLYYYSGDASPGEKNGNGINQIWWIAKPDYSIMQVSAQLIGHDGKSYQGDYTEGTGNTVYFVDDLGRTLYGFVNDGFDDNNFTREDFGNNAVWPIYEVNSLVSIPTGLERTDFSIITVFGKKQLSYKGWPLYYFGNDNMERGSNKGISFPSPGIWPVIQAGIEHRACSIGEVTYSGFVKNFVQNTCATPFCHGAASPAGGLALGNYDALKAAATSGRLYGAISHSQGFSPMPKDADKLDGCTIAKIKKWIDSGALQN